MAYGVCVILTGSQIALVYGVSILFYSFASSVFRMQIYGDKFLPLPLITFFKI